MKYSNIGGQAVMEGVMMRNGGKYAVAVRTVDGEIAVKTFDCRPLIKNEKIQKLPLIRGVINFIDSLVLGMTSLMYSAEFFAEETPQELEERLQDEMKKARRKADRLRDVPGGRGGEGLFSPCGAHALRQCRKMYP